MLSFCATDRIFRSALTRLWTALRFSQHASLMTRAWSALCCVKNCSSQVQQHHSVVKRVLHSTTIQTSSQHFSSPARCPTVTARWIYVVWLLQHAHSKWDKGRKDAQTHRLRSSTFIHSAKMLRVQTSAALMCLNQHRNLDSLLNLRNSCPWVAGFAR